MENESPIQQAAPIFAPWGGVCKSFGRKTDDSAKCSAPGEVDLQLVALIQAWPTLSKAVQQQIMLLVG